MENIQHNLLNSDDETILKTLESLNLSENEDLKDVLVILWQVHPDEAIKDRALGHLVTISDEQERGFIEEIFSVFRSIIEQLPWMGEYRELQASNFAKFLQGKDQYEALLTTSSVFVDYYLDLGRKLYMMFDLVDEAQVCFEGIVAHNGKNDEAFYALGRLNERKLKMDKALELYEKCIALNDSHIYGLLQLGILKAGQFKDYEGAIEHYNKVLEMEPFMAETNVRVAEAHYALGDVKRAKQFIDIALDINEFHDEALNLLGQIQWHHDEDIEAALETFQKGVDHKVHGDSALLLASLGELHAAHLGEYEKARVFYEKSLKEKPNQADTLRKLMVILENINQDYGAMSTCYENYFMIEKNDVSMYVDYANFLIKYMHDYEFAKMQLDSALEIDETNEAALKVKRQISDYIDDEEEDEDDDLIDDDDNDDGDDDDDDDDFSGGGAAGDN